ncbi:MAG: aldo/keto reductase, partial [Gemmatimonadota bacterium]
RAQEAGLNTKPIPSSGERMPVVGIGTRSYNTGASDEEMSQFRAPLEAFFEGGGVLLDTAAGYGDDTSEEVLGDLVTTLGHGDTVFWATKVDREGREEGIARREASFEKLQTEQVDLMQVHNLRGTANQLATIRDWIAAGRIRYCGVTTSSDRQYADLEQVMRNEELDFIQVDYSLGNRSAEERILPLAQDRGMAVLINLPFGRARLFDAVGDRPLPDWAGEIDCASWGQVFLKYVVSHPAVTCAIPGTTKPHHAVDNIAAARGRMPDAAMRRRMESFFDGL